MKEIQLTKGYVAIVDDEDYHEVAPYNWFAQTRSNNPCVYARRTYWTGSRTTNNRKSHSVLMHRQIMATDSKVDHRDGDGLNNRRSNLRVATLLQNNANRRKIGTFSSRFKGVSWSKEERKWIAVVRKTQNGVKKTYMLGFFRDETEAAIAYNRKALMLFGEFARLNEGVSLEEVA